MSVSSEIFNVQLRDQTGTAASVRLRRTGMVPAVLYGHGETNRHLAVPMTEIKMALRHHTKTVTLQGAVSDTALLSQVQFDHLGIEVLHLDLVRVNLKEQVEVEVSVSVQGESVGVRSGGILLENIHSVTVRCPAGEIPDSLLLDVNDLDLGGHKTAADLVLPPGVELLTASETVVVHIEKPKGGGSEVEGEAEEVTE
ncbi:MAG: 50S ribosomal protein L25 [Planctomycetaceae bacterium]|nr:MAG: 50S ribosomal protein L25 [Planctomycetaceae bacterium]